MQVLLLMATWLIKCVRRSASCSQKYTRAQIHTMLLLQYGENNCQATEVHQPANCALLWWQVILTRQFIWYTWIKLCVLYFIWCTTSGFCYLPLPTLNEYNPSCRSTSCFSMQSILPTNGNAWSTVCKKEAGEWIFRMTVTAKSQQLNAHMFVCSKQNVKGAI